MAHVYLGLGTNLGDRAANVRSALERLESRAIVAKAVSPFYETEPWGVEDQPRFLNAACLVETDLEPLALLDALKDVEHALGRQETVRYGPRPIDLDILLYGDLCLDSVRLTIPHAGMLARSTVLVPLVDIAPEVRHPVTGRTLRDHLADLRPVVGIAPYPPGLAGSGSSVPNEP